MRISPEKNAAHCNYIIYILNSLNAKSPRKLSPILITPFHRCIRGHHLHISSSNGISQDSNLYAKILHCTYFNLFMEYKFKLVSLRCVVTKEPGNGGIGPNLARHTKPHHELIRFYYRD